VKVELIHHAHIYCGMTVDTLEDNGFSFVGSWRTIDCKPHKAPWIRHQSGLYAFAVGDEVVYIGLAKVLHRRLRNYSRRAFRDLNRAPRAAHSSIASGVAGGFEVKVFAKVMPEADRAALLQAETALIQQMHPVWNRTYLFKG
jgi:excinuclease UvrABC nuclease subunit